jgi:hypothetical protein
MKQRCAFMLAAFLEAMCGALLVCTPPPVGHFAAGGDGIVLLQLHATLNATISLSAGAMKGRPSRRHRAKAKAQKKFKEKANVSVVQLQQPAAAPGRWPSQAQLLISARGGKDGLLYAAEDASLASSASSRDALRSLRTEAAERLNAQLLENRELRNRAEALSTEVMDLRGKKQAVDRRTDELHTAGSGLLRDLCGPLAGNFTPSLPSGDDRHLAFLQMTPIGQQHQYLTDMFKFKNASDGAQQRRDSLDAQMTELNNTKLILRKYISSERASIKQVRHRIYQLRHLRDTLNETGEDNARLAASNGKASKDLNAIRANASEALDVVTQLWEREAALGRRLSVTSQSNVSAFDDISPELSSLRSRLLSVGGVAESSHPQVLGEDSGDLASRVDAMEDFLGVHCSSKLIQSVGRHEELQIEAMALNKSHAELLTINELAHAVAARLDLGSKNESREIMMTQLEKADLENRVLRKQADDKRLSNEKIAASLIGLERVNDDLRGEMGFGVHPPLGVNLTESLTMQMADTDTDSITSASLRQLAGEVQKYANASKLIKSQIDGLMHGSVPKRLRLLGDEKVALQSLIAELNKQHPALVTPALRLSRSHAKLWILHEKQGAADAIGAAEESEAEAMEAAAAAGLEIVNGTAAALTHRVKEGSTYVSWSYKVLGLFSIIFFFLLREYLSAQFVAFDYVKKIMDRLSAQCTSEWTFVAASPAKRIMAQMKNLLSWRGGGLTQQVCRLPVSMTRFYKSGASARSTEALAGIPPLPRARPRDHGLSGLPLCGLPLLADHSTLRREGPGWSRLAGKPDKDHGQQFSEYEGL